MHLGLIGGIGPAATEYYYRGLVKAYAGENKVLELTIAHANINDLLRNLSNGAAKQQSEIFQEHIHRLKSAGAQVAGVAALAGHFCIEQLEAVSPLPIVSAIPEFDKYFKQSNLSRVGIMGTRAVMESRLYGGITSVDVVLPKDEDFDAVHDNYIAMAMSSQATDDQRDLLFSAGEKLCNEQAAQAVLLAGTDFFLAFDGRDCGYPVIDSAQLHIDALARESFRAY
jgi:aspartate racemase